MSLGNPKFPADYALKEPEVLDTCRLSEKVTVNGKSSNNVRAEDLDTVSVNAEVFKSPQMSRDSPCVTDDRSNISPVDTFLSLSLSGYTDHSKRAGKRSRICEYLCDDPPQWNDSDTQNPRTGIHDGFDEASHQLIDSCPSNLSLSISSNAGSPESILKSSAISYRNTPSIIRKKAFRDAASGIYSTTFSPMLVLSGSSNRKYADSGSGSSVTGQAVERRLEYAFDLEWNSTSMKCYSPGSAALSSELTADKKIMLTP